MRICLCGYLGAGCTEVARILASRLKLKNVGTIVNISVISSPAEGVKSVVRSGVDPDTTIRKRVVDFLNGDNVVVEGRSAFRLLDRNDARA